MKVLGRQTVLVSADDVAVFNSRWPCSPIPEKRLVFNFASNGDLVDIYPDSSKFDGDALLALSQDAQKLLSKGMYRCFYGSWDRSQRERISRICRKNGIHYSWRKHKNPEWIELWVLFKDFEKAQKFLGL